VIGLEALLSRESDEIAFRLSRRVGLLLGATDLERLEVSSLVRTAYKIRNQIVHGGEAKDSYMVEGRPLSAEAISHRIERVLARCAIIVGLSRAEIPRNELIEDLDRGLLSDEATRPGRTVVRIWPAAPTVGHMIERFGNAP